MHRGPPDGLLREVFGNVHSRDVFMAIGHAKAPVRYSALRQRVGLRPSEFQRAIGRLNHHEVIQRSAARSADPAAEVAGQTWFEMTPYGADVFAWWRAASRGFDPIAKRFHVPAVGYVRDRADLRRHRATIRRLAALHGVTNVRVYGSVARGEAGPGSDLDLLVELSSGYTLFDLVAFERELGEALGLKVQVLTEGALHPVFRHRVLAEAVPA